jgi:hypothetical protein
MLTIEERLCIRTAYAEAATFADMCALGAVLDCYLCAIPDSLRDPEATWPECAHIRTRQRAGLLTLPLVAALANHVGHTAAVAHAVGHAVLVHPGPLVAALSLH